MATQPQRYRLTVWLLLVAGLLLPICGLVCVYFWPRQEQLDAYCTGYYYGLGQHDQPGFFGKNWYSARENLDALGTWEYQLDGFGWTRFRAHYPNGKLLAEGVCWVDEEDGTPTPNSSRVLQASFYDPAGNLASQVVDGSGREVVFWADGTLAIDIEISNTQPHGSYALVDPNGTTMTRGRCENGEWVGVWLRFYSDGSLEKTSDRSFDPPKEVWFERGEKFLSGEEIADLLAP